MSRLCSGNVKKEVNILIAKKDYTQPQLTIHGTISDLTLQAEPPKSVNCPPDKFGRASCGAVS